MKKLLTLTAVIMVLAMPAALADHHGDGDMGDKAHHEGGMFAKKDTNGDGVISKQEFLDAKMKWAEEKFNKMDADGNGEISMEESKAAHAKMKDKWKERKGDHGMGMDHGDAADMGEEAPAAE